MIDEKKLEWLIGLIVIILTGLISTGYSYASAKSNNDSIIIVIDAGHGGTDPGKVGINDALEKDINLKISKYLSEYLNEAGFSTVMTRTDDNGLYSENSRNKKQEDLLNRCKIINSSNADYTISIHQNSYSDSSAKGAQVFYYSGSKEGKKLAETIQKSLINNLDKNNKRSAKNNNSYYILKNSSSPTVIVECGFLSNPDEADKLCDKEYQQAAAKAICEGFIDFYE